MFGMRWRLFRLLGIPISVDASWLILLALLTLSLGSAFPVLVQQYFPGTAPELAPYEYRLMGLVAAVAFFGCILLHELGHAVVARSQGMPIRGVTLFLFGGVAEMEDEPTSAGNEFFMAIAGPVVSVILAVGLGFLAWLGYYGGWPHPVVIVLGYLAFINTLVLVFNLNPAFPLDGGRVLRSILWSTTGDLRRATHWAALLGQTFAWLLIAWGVLQFFMGNWLGGIWMGLIGMFLSGAARSGYQQVLVRQALQGEPVRRFMNPEPIAVPPSLDLRHWVEDFVYRYHRKTFPVVADGHLEGFNDTSALGQVPRPEWARRTIGEVMRHDLGAITIAPDADALQALGMRRRTGSSRLLVAQGDRLVGILSLKDLLSFLHLKIELEGPDGEDVQGSTWGACIGTERRTQPHRAQEGPLTRWRQSSRHGNTDNSYSRGCIMATNWSQEKREGSTQVEREAERHLRAHSKSLVPMPTRQIEHPLTTGVEAESLPGAGYTQWRAWFLGWDVMLAALGGVVIFFVLDIASLGVLGSAVTVACIGAAFGLVHYLLWGRVFARRVVQERRRFQDQARRLETSETDPPDEFLLGLNDRERVELLQLLEQSLVGTTGGREEGDNSGTIRRELQDKIRMFGA